MSCNDYEIRIGPYVDGELPRGEREDVEGHIERCSSCRRMATEFTALDRMAGRGNPPRVTAIEWRETLSMVQQRAREGSKPDPAWNRSRLTAVASLAAALLIAAFLAVGDHSDPVNEQSDSPIVGPERRTETDPTEPRVADRPEEDRDEVSPEESSDTTDGSSRF